MTKLRKKLLLSVLTLALTFIALGSTTFAWFTIGNTATANAFTGTVQGGQGIDIAFVGNTKITSADNAKKYAWAMSVNLADKVSNEFRFKDLTSKDGRTIINMKREDQTQAANTNYLEINLYVRSMGQLSELKLTSLTDVLSEEFDWNPDATVKKSETEYEYAVDAAEKWNALNALRVSFTVGNNKLVTNVLEFQTSSNHGAADITAAGLAAKYAAAKNHNITAYLQTTNEGYLPSTAVINTLTEITDSTKFTATLDGALNGNPDAINLLGAGENAANATFTYTDNGITYSIYELVLRVWMEGWDGDCINAVLTKSVGFGFTLEGKVVSQN